MFYPTLTLKTSTWPDHIAFYFIVPMEIVPMGNWGRFPWGKPDARKSRYPTLNHYSPSAHSIFVWPYKPLLDIDSFTTDTYGIFEVRTKLIWVRAVHTKVLALALAFKHYSIFNLRLFLSFL